MKVTLKFFASLREICGRPKDTFELPEGQTVGEFRDKAVERYPGLEGIIEMTLPVVNMKYVEHDRVLENGDDVTFIPPVSGG